ncbi:MAG: UvrD-helicase domain-containing protein, partial [Pseudomonadota bacterium]
MTRPTPEQIEATDPRVSCWVTANAGSGKTHVLTQRVARLLLAGCEPQKILCLTYTKAAAAEMQTRLFRLLGDWTMASTEDLRSGLAALSGSEAPVASEAQLSRARQLFARALESPGGLKIQTIHAFCDSLLRRFPLEASISPQFNVTDDRDRETLVAGVRAVMAEAAADGRDPAFDKAADLLTEDGIDQLTAGVLGNRSRLDADGLEDRLAGHFGNVVADTETAICKRALARLNWDQYAALSDVLLTKGGKQDQSLGAVLALPAAQREADPSGAVDALISRMLTSSFRARATERFPVKNVKSAYPAAADEIAALSAWALETRDLILSRRTAQRTRDLYGFSGGLLDRYAAAKHNRGLMDFDDLVSRARALLVDRAMRGWVLYKLDEGIDHILVDEAQDTAPLQWDVIKAISDEFLSGDGAARGPRTIFVVGDEKQSIYSFQGADPGAFAGVRDIYRRRLSDLGDRLVRPLLRTSFRSAPAILEFVDAVFDGPLAACLTTDPEGVGHHAHRNGERGRVDLWPLLAKPEAAEPPPWWEPVDTVPLSDPRQKLAETLAGEISAMIGTATLPARAGRPARFVRPGDILVLVARRNPWTAVIIRHLKALGVPVTGADRLRLSDALSVKDLLALLRFVTLPDDDLSLAAVLRSPLGGISEEALFQLAHGRDGTLHAALRQSPEHTELRKMIDDLSREADFLRPYEMLERILVRHRGRHKLL